MTPERYARVCELAEAALALPSKQRDEFLRRESGEDRELHEAAGRHLRELILLDQQGAGGLTTPPMTTPFEAETGPSEVGRQVGRYRLEELIGRGGMGEVYRAVRLEDYTQQVAVKIMRLEPGAAGLERFRREREVLAGLDHPNVVRLLDGGTIAPEGRLFLVMEHVAGRPLDDYCKEAGLGVRERLLLFQQVCLAVAHAHGRGVLHRDLKPANVLVTAEGTAKVADFGLARWLSEGSGTDVAQTVSGMILGTPAYMSPEQAAGRQAPGPASDVYGLGATLYALLLGRPPFKAATLEETLRQVREQEPVPPRRLDPSIHRDLETIVLHCLHKEPQRRYAGAAELADDLRCFLQHEPIRARPVGRLERFGLWCRRRPREAVFALASVLVLLAVAVGLGVFLVERGVRRTRTNRDVRALMRQAREARARAEGAPVEQLGDWQEALRLAREAAVLAEQGADPDVLADAHDFAGELGQDIKDRRLLARLRQVYLDKAAIKGEEFDLCAAIAAYAKAFRDYDMDVERLSARESIARLADRPAIHAAVAEALDDWVTLLLTPGQAGGGRHLIDVANALDPKPISREFREAALVRRDPARLKRLASSPKVLELRPAMLSLLGRILVAASETDAGVGLLLRARQRYANDFWINLDLGLSLHGAKRPAEAVPYYMAATALQPGSAGAWVNLANGLSDIGSADASFDALQRALRAKPDLAAAHHNLGEHWKRKGDLSRAVACYRRAVELRPSYARAWHHLGGVYHLQKDYVRAEDAFARAVAADGKDPSAWLNLGVARAARKDFAGALAAYEGALRQQPDSASIRGAFRELLLAVPRPPGQARTLYCRATGLSEKVADSHLRAEELLNEGQRLSGRKDYRGAEGLFRRGLLLNPDSYALHVQLGSALWGQKKLEAAAAAFRTAVRLDPVIAGAWADLGSILAEQKKWDEAVACCREALRLEPAHAAIRYNLGNILMHKGDLAGAVAAYRFALARQPGHRNARFNLGVALLRLNRFAEAVAELDALLKVSPEDAKVHINRGIALQGVGRFAEALAAFEKGEELGSKQPGWSRPGARLMDQCRPLAQLDQRLAAVLRGAAFADAGERLRLADFCLIHKKCYATAAGWYEQVLREQPGRPRDALLATAARAALLAGLGQGQDTPRDEARQAALRRQGLDHLREELRTLAAAAGRDAKTRATLLARAQALQADPDLAPLRDRRSLAALPAAERRQWGEWWEELRATIARFIDP